MGENKVKKLRPRGGGGEFCALNIRPLKCNKIMKQVGSAIWILSL